MSDAICLQPWLSISGNANTVLQDAAEWLDVSRYQGVAVYTQVTYVTDQVPTTALDVQTSASRDEAFFAAKLTGGGNPWVVSYTFGASPPLGVQPIAIRRWTDATVATTPPQRFLRWRVRFPAGDTSMVFRIWLNLLRNAGTSTGKAKRSAAPMNGLAERIPPASFIPASSLAPPPALFGRRLGK